MSERPPITLRDLDAIDVAQLRGVGDKKRASLAAFGVDTVLDLVTTYPRRWVDRTNEARIADLVPQSVPLRHCARCAARVKNEIDLDIVRSADFGDVGAVGEETLLRHEAGADLVDPLLEARGGDKENVRKGTADAGDRQGDDDQADDRQGRRVDVRRKPLQAGSLHREAEAEGDQQRRRDAARHDPRPHVQANEV